MAIKDDPFTPQIVPASQASWNNDEGWRLCFPEDEEGEDHAPPSRSTAVAELVTYFRSDAGMQVINSIPVGSYAMSMSHDRMVAEDAPRALRNAAEALANNPDEVLSQLSLAALRAGESLCEEKTVLMCANAKIHERVVPRITNFSPLTHIRSLRAASVGKFVSIRGTVVRSSTMRQQVASMKFYCSKCTVEQQIPFPDFRIIFPTSCPTPRCRGRSFQPIYDSAETVDWQRIRIQEIQDRDGQNREEGRMPRTIDAELCADLIDYVIPGDVVVVTGIVRAMKIESGGGGKQARSSRSLYYMYISANSISNPRKSADKMLHLDLDDAQMNQLIRDIMEHDDPFSFLVHSACPSIFGNDVVKSGMLLALFGGAEKKHIGPSGKTEVVPIRKDSHVLVVGDPGLGKSQMLKAMCRIAPRGVYVCGNTTTTAGLTVTVVREPSGEFALEAGALVLGDGGVCCIDEFDKMSAEHAALLEGMEQQSVSVAKAGLVCNLSARTSVIAAANPHGGQYDRSRTVSENLKLPQPLLSRFDLIFILLDRPDKERDRHISNHIMRMFGIRDPASQNGACFGKGAAVKDPSQKRTQDPRKSLLERLSKPRPKDLLPAKVFRQYIAYARTHCHPVMSDGAKAIIQDFFLQLRKGAKKQDTTPVTVRQLESLIRLSEARARAVLRNVVEPQDAQDVVDIFRESMLQTLTNEHGEIELSRANGMSRAADVRKFENVINAESHFARTARFHISKLRALADKHGIAGERFDRVIETMNIQGYFLKKGGGNYELTNSNFSQAG